MRWRFPGFHQTCPKPNKHGGARVSAVQRKTLTPGSQSNLCLEEHLLTNSAGHLFNSFLFKIKDNFFHMHNKGLRQLFLTVLWDFCAYRATPDEVLEGYAVSISKFLEGMYEVKLTALEGSNKSPRLKRGSYWKEQKITVSAPIRSH